MELHHSKHHEAHVTGANTPLDQLAEAHEKDDFANANKLDKNVTFNPGVREAGRQAAMTDERLPHPGVRRSRR